MSRKSEHMKRLIHFIRGIIFGNPKRGEKAYPDSYGFKTTYPEKKISEEGWKLLHNVNEE
jgi:hypothetical protein